MDREQSVIIYQSGEIELKVSVAKEIICLDAKDIEKLFDVQALVVL